jgi:asparagine synthase (glutamine-hydrolysing)
VDVDLVELVLRLPPELAFDPSLSRPLLRESVAGVLPDEVRLRPSKSSFDAVFHASLAGPDLPTIRRLLEARDAKVSAYVDVGAVRRELLDPGPPMGRTRSQWAIQVWRLVLAECWLQDQDQPGFAAQLASAEGLASVDYEVVTVNPRR